MTRTRTLEPAFPRTYVADGHNGMDLRDYFAAKVLQGKYAAGSAYQTPETTAKDCYAMADAMMKAREQ